MEPITTEDYAAQIKQMVKDFQSRADDNMRAGGVWRCVEVLENPLEQGYVYLKIQSILVMGRGGWDRQHGWNTRIDVEQAFPGIEKQFHIIKEGEHGDAVFRDTSCTYVAVPCTHDSVLQLNKIHRKIYIDKEVDHLKRILAEYQTSINDENVFRFLVNKGLNECGFGLAGYKGPEEVEDVDDMTYFGVIKSFSGISRYLEYKLGESAAKDAFVEVIKKALPPGMKVEKVNQLGG